MSEERKIKSALVSVFYKDGLEPIIQSLHKLGITIYSTGGTEKFIRELGIPVTAVENITDYPSIFGGRVKTLHPKIFGGILSRRDHAPDITEAKQFQIPAIDLVIVDLYPFEETVASGAVDEDIIEKIDIGGISLIRAAAKNFKDVLIIPSKKEYPVLQKILDKNNGLSTLEERKQQATHAFSVSSQYDSAILNFFDKTKTIQLKNATSLRYGENPHQQGVFYGNMDDVFEQLNGKELSYNNLLDTDAALDLIAAFHDSCTCAIIKHNNACGIASAENLTDAWKKALAGDPISAFGGIIVANQPVDLTTATEMHKLFFEILIAPAYEEKAFSLLKEKKNRILLQLKKQPPASKQFRTLLNGVIEQDKDNKTENAGDLKIVTTRKPSPSETDDLLFANKIVKHSKSNAIVLAGNKQLLASGVGQTSRIDALKHAIEKATSFGFDLKGAVMASDAFFPFPDCVEIANKAGITAVIQPGGSVKDQESVDYCNHNQMAMVFTGFRHFKH